MTPPSHTTSNATLPAHALVVPSSRLMYGADYNPEQWDRDTWCDDVRLMREAGLTHVSLGIWSWTMLEPRPGHYDFTLLDEILTLLTGADISIDLATPTTAPPSWFYRAHPEARLIEADGTIRHGGSRGICCPHSPAYADAANGITEALAAHVADNPHITMWHVHNEYGAPDARCHCDTSQIAFRTWLRQRYGSLDALNEAWGTTFWGQTYHEWEEISTPRHSGTALNPTCELDFARFTSDSLLQRFIAERDIIRRHCPHTPITTNLMVTNCQENDYWRWAEQMDVISTDYYLEADNPENYIWLAMESDLTRSLAGGHPWVLMEHSVSAVSWQPHNWAKMPGEERRNALAHVARGADGIMAFQWRASRRGAEKFHSAMVPHAGENTRVFQEVCALGRDLHTLSDLRDSRVHARIALLWDWNSLWAQDLMWRPSVLMRHREQMRRVYQWLWERGTTVDFAHPEADLTAYDTVIAPASYLISAQAATNLSTFVDNGGTLVALPFFAVVDGEECVHDGGSPGPLRDVLGLDVEEFRPIRQGDTITLRPAVDSPADASEAVPARLWSEDLRLHGATPAWVADDGPTPGPAVTTHRYGRGLAVYVSVVLEADELARVLEPLIDLPSDTPATTMGSRPHRIEAVTRHATDGSGRRWLTLINHDDVDHCFALDGVDVLGERTLTAAQPTTLAAGDVLIVRMDSAQ